MPTYDELQAEIAKLQRQAEDTRRKEVESAVTAIRELMRNHGITIADLAPSEKKRQTATPPVKVAAKYRDPVSGATWTGRGRAPLWLNGKSKDQFLIED